MSRTNMPSNARSNAAPNPTPVADATARQRALSIDESFIVRAPAGAGKTRLLIQRYLALLATVDAPEEIIAITFTRKAAAEMRARVMNAFHAAIHADIPEDTLTRHLAACVLSRDRARGDERWNVEDSAARLRIQTIDSLNASLTRQMPVLARFGAQPASTEDAMPLYEQAALDLLNELDAPDAAVADDLATLLLHLDNQRSMVLRLIADMLAARDHWLRNLPAMHARESLEAALQQVSMRAVAHVATLFPVAEKK